MKNKIQPGTRKYVKLPVTVIEDFGTGWVNISIKIHANQEPIKVYFQKRLLRGK